MNDLINLQIQTIVAYVDFSSGATDRETYIARMRWLREEFEGRESGPVTLLLAYTKDYAGQFAIDGTRSL